MQPVEIGVPGGGVLPGDTEPVGVFVHEGDLDVGGWVRLHCGERVHGFYVAAGVLLRKDPRKLCRPPTAGRPPAAAHGPHQTSGIEGKPPRPSSSPNPWPSPSLSLPKALSNQRGGKQLEGTEGGLQAHTYEFRNPQTIEVCWSCSQRGWRRTGILCRKSCPPPGPAAGRRTSWTPENTGMAPGRPSEVGAD